MCVEKSPEAAFAARDAAGDAAGDAGAATRAAWGRYDPVGLLERLVEGEE